MRQEKRLPTERAQKEGVSVYDFLYADHERIAVLHSQFNEFGHLTRLVKQATVSNEAGGGVNLQVADIKKAERSEDTLEREYDARWALPLAFLEELADRQFIQGDLSAARIGQFVLATGALSIRDMGMVKAALELKSLKEDILSPPGHLAKEDYKNERKNRAQGLEALSIVPDSIQLELRVDGKTLWGLLQSQGMVTSVGDMVLKYGVRIPGDWSVLGVLDALPDPSEMSQQLYDMNNVASTDWGRTGLGVLMTLFGPLARHMLGRRPDQLGVTPLVVFREVVKPA